jgi:hypothetical protein
MATAWTLQVVGPVEQAITELRAQAQHATGRMHPADDCHGKVASVVRTAEYYANLLREDGSCLVGGEPHLAVTAGYTESTEHGGFTEYYSLSVFPRPGPVPPKRLHPSSPA